MPGKGNLYEIPGTRTLVEWFGRVPRFHDAELLEVTFSHMGTGLLRVHAWNTTEKVDAQGVFVLDKHATVTFRLEQVSEINCTDFDVMPAIIFDLEIIQMNAQIRIEWNASYGVSGFVVAKRLAIDLVPGRLG